MTTETIDKLFLELSLVTTAKTAREVRLERERDEAREALRVARTDRDREAHDRQTTSDAWNDMRRQRDAALVERNAAIEQAKHVGACLVECSARAEQAERERDYVSGYEADLVAIRRVLDAVDAPHDCEDGCSMEPKRIRLLAAERDEARAERDRRPDISAEDAAHAIQFFRGWDAPGSVTDRVFAALRAHAQKAVKL